MANLFKIPSGKLISFIGKLASQGFTAEMAENLDMYPDYIRLLVRCYQELVVDPPMYADVVYEELDAVEVRRRYKMMILDTAVDVELKTTEQCRFIRRINRELAFRYVEPNGFDSDEEILAKISERNMRPAIYDEFLSFVSQHPLEQSKYPIYELGSVVVVDGTSYYVFASNSRDRNVWQHCEDAELVRCNFVSLTKNTFTTASKRILCVDKNWRQ